MYLYIFTDGWQMWVMQDSLLQTKQIYMEWITAIVINN